MNFSPKISIVLPTHNGERWLAESIQSIILQSEIDWELIVVDDFSSDGSYDVARYFAAKDSRISIIRNGENKKLPASLNIGFSEANGKYLTWTSDDNLYKPDALKKMANYMDLHPGVDLAAFNMDVINDEGEFLYEWSSLWPARRVIDLAHGCNVGAAFIYSRNTLSNIGVYDEKMFCAEDYEYWIRVALNGRIDYVDEVNVYKYRLHSNSLTASKEHLVKQKTAEIQENYIDDFSRKFNLNFFEIAKLIYNSHIDGWQSRFIGYWPVLIIFNLWDLFFQVIAFIISPKDRLRRRSIRKIASAWTKPGK